MFEKVQNCYVVKNQPIDINIFYLNDINDTVSINYLVTLFQHVYASIEKFVPDLFQGFTFEIWNHLRKDKPQKDIEYVPSKKKIIISTAFLDNKDNNTWGFMVSRSISYCFMAKIKFRKKGPVYKKWLALRVGVNSDNPEETFLEDFLNLFAFQHYKSTINISTVFPTNISGLKNLLYLWYNINYVLSKFTTLILWYSFLSIPKMDYLGFIYFVFDFKVRKFSIKRITSQGHWVYSIETDQWELEKSFKLSI